MGDEATSHVLVEIHGGARKPGPLNNLVFRRLQRKRERVLFSVVRGLVEWRGGKPGMSGQDHGAFGKLKRMKTR